MARSSHLHAPDDPAFVRRIWRYPIDSRPRLDDALRRHAHLEVIELNSPGQVREFLVRPTR
ncbi:MAG TPA: hypothetical protein VHV82_13800 [Sporichthyaceae bacterium]|jgi:hypothetical protein|nr:hypothetical protein [Sporichthyaceae bacterium]